MLTITASRIKKAILHPQNALRYLFNYVQGQWLRWKLENRFLKFIFSDRKRKINFEVIQSGIFFTDNEDFLKEIANQGFIIPTANRLLNNEFGFLGINLKILKHIDWHQDIKSGHIWSNNFYLDLREKLIKDYDKGYDIKNVWELSRFHYLVPLALAYYQTGEEKYLNKWQELITDWIKNNPVYYGPNWINTMEVAIRVCNWIFSWQIVQIRLLRRFAPRNDEKRVPCNYEKDVTCNDEKRVPCSDEKAGVIASEAKQSLQEFLEKFPSSLYEHGRFIFNNLEYAPMRSNHYLTDLVGLIYLGVFFKNLKEGSKWLNFGKKALEKEMIYQVYNDGVDYELSISYHRYVTELFLWASWLLKLNKFDLPVLFWQKLEKMIQFVINYTKTNNFAPQIGDSDDSRLHLIWEDYYQWEKRNHFAVQKLYSLVNKISGITTFTEIIDKTGIITFPDAGFYIIRDKNFYLITGHRSPCYGKGGSHIHNDLLSFELNLNSEDIIIDPGTSCYTPNLSERNKFRGTKAHNVLIIDGQEQNLLTPDPFYLQQETDIILSQEEDNKNYYILELKLKHWQRQFSWNKLAKEFLLKDKLILSGKHTLEWNFHLSPQIKTWVKDNSGDKREIILVGNNSYLFTAPKNLNCAIIEDEVSPSYGIKLPAKTICLSGFLDKDNPHEFEFKIEPIK